MDPKNSFPVDLLSQLYDFSGDLSSREDDNVVFNEIKNNITRYTEFKKIRNDNIKHIFRVFDEYKDRYVLMEKVSPIAPKEVYDLFLREVRMIAKLEHPSIIPVYDIGVHADGTPYFTTKNNPGVRISELFNEMSNTISSALIHESLFITYLVRVCDAMDYAHSRNILHTNLNPDNIYFGRYGEVLVSGWVMAQYEDPTIEKENDVDVLLNQRILENFGYIKSSEYWAPEQHEGINDRRSDVYGLGQLLDLWILFYEEEITAGSSLEDKLEEMKGVAKKAKSENPMLRYQTVCEMKLEILKIMK